MRPKKKTTRIPKEIMMDLRRIVMGEEAAVFGPPLWESMEKLGYKKCVERFKYVIDLKTSIDKSL